MKCSLCGYEFNENEAQNSCKCCPMGPRCKLIKCPNCGFETPPEPQWLKSLFKRKGKDEAK